MPARFERLRHRLDRADAHDVGIDAGRPRSVTKRASGSRPSSSAFERRISSTRGGAVGVRARVARRHGAVRLERRLAASPAPRRSSRRAAARRARTSRRSTCFSAPFHVTRSTGTGTIWSSNAPLATRRAAFCWLPSAHASWSARLTFHRSATRSAVKPMPMYDSVSSGIEPRVVAGHRHLAHHLDAAGEHDVGHAAHDLPARRSRSSAVRTSRSG